MLTRSVDLITSRNTNMKLITKQISEPFYIILFYFCIPYNELFLLLCNQFYSPFAYCIYSTSRTHACPNTRSKCFTWNMILWSFTVSFKPSCRACSCSHKKNINILILLSYPLVSRPSPVYPHVRLTELLLSSYCLRDASLLSRNFEIQSCLLNSACNVRELRNRQRSAVVRFNGFMRCAVQ